VDKGRYCAYLRLTVMVSVGGNHWICKLNIHTRTPFCLYFQYS